MSDLILDEDFNDDNKPSEFTAETVTKINLAKISAEENIKFVKNGRTALFVLAGFALIGIIVGIFSNPYEASTNEVLMEGAILLFVYLSCALLIKKNATVALAVAFSIYLLFILLTGLIDVSYIFKGLVVKIAIIFYLSKAIMGAIGLKKNLKKLFDLGIPLAEIDKLKNLEEVPRTPYPKGDLA